MPSLPLLLALAIGLPAIAHAQIAPAPAPATTPPQDDAGAEKKPNKRKKVPAPLSGVPFLKMPTTDLSLMGDAYADNNWGFELRLPKGFAVLSDADLVRYRQALFTPEKDRTVDGNVIQIENWRFQSADGTAWITIKVHKPAMKIESPKDLLDYYKRSDEVSGVTSAETGKLLQFQSRGGRIGYIAQRENAVLPGRPITHKTTMAYLRVDERSMVIQCSAPKETFDQLDLAFNQALTSLSLKEGRRVDPTVTTSPNRKTTMSNTRSLVITNVALLLLVLFAVVKAMRGRIDPQPATP